MNNKITSMALVSVLWASNAIADINVGISLSATGAQASLGVPQKNTSEILPKKIGNEKVNYIVLDDASDPTQAAKNARKLTSEDKVDIIIGSSTTPTSLAIVEIAHETGTPQITLAPINIPDTTKEKWIFRTPQHIRIMAGVVGNHMISSGIKTVGFIGFTDPYGADWLSELKKIVEPAGIKIIADERYNRTDTSVTGQVLKVLGANPDAVLVGASGVPSTLPQVGLVEKGYKGKIYQTHGSANLAVMKAGGDAMKGALLPVGPVVVASQLPDSHPSKKLALEYIKTYEDKFGAGTFSTFGAHLWDGFHILERGALTALKKAKPGTPEFRTALRDAIEGDREIVGVHGVFNMEPHDHFGLDKRGGVLVVYENDTFKIVK